MATYYVRTDGNDSNTGTSNTSGGAWLTATKAGTTATAGDTVNFTAGTYSQALSPSNSGSAGNLITFQNFPGDSPIISVTSGPALTLSSRSYIKVSGLKFEANSLGRWLQMVTGLNCIITGCIFQNALPSAGHGAYIETSDNNQFINTQFLEHGTGVSSYVGTGGCQVVSSDNNLWSGCTFQNANHASFQLIGCQFNVMLNCRITNNYGQAAEIHDATLSTPPSQFNTWDGCFISAPNVGLDTLQSDGHEFSCRHNIIRRCIFYNSQADGLGMQGYLDNGGENSENVFGNRVYNNVFYANGKEAGLADWTDGRAGLAVMRFEDGPTMNDNIFKNNAIYQNKQNGDPIQIYIIDWSTPGTIISGLKFEYNALRGNSAGQTIIRFANNGPTEEGSISYFESTYPSSFANNIEAVESFMNPAAGDFRLQANSPLINAGSVLTRTNGSGSGTSVTVLDSRYFMDGYSGVTAGDTVRIGNQTVTITSINYGTHVLTIDRSISWANNDLVSLPFNGAAPDIGAVEFAPATVTHCYTNCC